MLRVVPECIPGMKQPHAIDILDVSFLEIQPKREFLCQKVHCIQSLRLCFRDRRDIRATLLGKIASEVAA